ncbi:SpoIIE family protein phosphatase [bacterium]|nr:SpoIIE family protein phosphatase [bacterium]
MTKKSRRGFHGSLGFRVLSISIVFLGIPLMIYSAALYVVDYRQYVRNLYEEVDLMSREEIDWVAEQESFHRNTLTLIDEFVTTFHLRGNTEDHQSVNAILKKFTLHQNISAIVYNRVTPQGQIICKKSTLSLYEGVDFSRYFSLKDLRSLKEAVFISKDPVFGYSFYVVRYIHRDGAPDAVVMAIVSLETMLSQMNEFQNTTGLSISVLDKDHKVIASTNHNYEGKRFDEKEGDNTIVMDKISYVEKGHTFVFKGKKHFIDIRKIPKTDKLLMISIPETVIMHSFLSFLTKLGLFLLFVIIVGGLLTYFFTRRMARPMRQLSNVMSSVGTGHLESTYKEDKYGFEINGIGEAFNQMRKNLLDYIEQVKTEKGLKEAFEKELQIGHQIQRAILPDDDAHVDGVDIATYYSPAKEVAGDFYDFLEIDEDKVLMTIADGVGKGISSCLYSFDLRSILRTAALQSPPLDDLVKRANTIFCADTKESCNFVTLVTGYLNKKEKYYEFTDAGHLPVFVKRKNGAVEQFTTKGIALGIEELSEVEVSKISLETGDYCVMYTDGIVEAFNEEEKQYTPERLLRAIESFSGNSSQELADLIMKDVLAFSGKKEQHDDISLIVFRLQ